MVWTRRSRVHHPPQRTVTVRIPADEPARGPKRPAARLGRCIAAIGRARCGSIAAGSEEYASRERLPLPMKKVSATDESDRGGTRAGAAPIRGRGRGGGHGGDEGADRQVATVTVPVTRSAAAGPTHGAQRHRSGMRCGAPQTADQEGREIRTRARRDHRATRRSHQRKPPQRRPLKHRIGAAGFELRAAKSVSRGTWRAAPWVGDAVRSAADRRPDQREVEERTPCDHRATRRSHQRKPPQRRPLKHRIGAAGFEPTTSCSQSRRSTKLSYAPCEGPIVAARGESPREGRKGAVAR